jgi:hypothetical protein
VVTTKRTSFKENFIRRLRKMTYTRLRITIDTLVKTGLEKVNVLGIEDAQNDLWQIYEMCEELLRFWEDEITDDQDYELEKIIAKLPLLQRA